MGRNQPHPPKLSGQHPSRRRRESSSSAAGASPGTNDGSDEDDRSLSSSRRSKKKASAASRARSASTTRAHQTNSETIRGGRTRKPNPRSADKSSKMPSPQNSKHQNTESEEDEDFDDENSLSQTEQTKPAAAATRKRPNVRITRSSSSKQSKSSAPDEDDDASASKRQRRQQPSRAAARDSKINYTEPEVDDEDDQVDESEDDDDKSVVIMDSVEVFDGDQPIDSNDSRTHDSISGESKSKSKSSTNRSSLNYTPYQPPPSTHAQPQERVDPSCPEFLERHHRALRRVHFEQEERDDDASSVTSRSSQRSCNSQKRRRRRSKKNQSSEDDEASVSSRASTSSTSNRTASRQNQATTGKRSALKTAPTYDHRLFAKEGQLPQKKATSNSVSSSPAWQQKPAAKSTTSQQSRAAPPASTAAATETGSKKTRGRPRKQAPVSVPVVGQDDDDGSAQTTQAGNGSFSSIDQTTRRGGTQSARAGQPLTPGLETTSSEIPRDGRGPSRNHPVGGSAGASSTPKATTTHGPAPFDGTPPTAFPAQNGTSVNNRTPRVELSTHIRNLRWPSTAKTSLEWLKATIDDRVLADDEGGGVISDELKEYLTEAKMMGLYMELIYCIAAFPTREDVQRLGIFTLDALLMVRENRELLITLDHGIIGLIIKAMQSHSGHIELINRGVHCLMTIFSAPGDVMSLDEATLTELKDASLSKFMSDSSAISTILNSTNDQHIFKDVYTQTYLMNLITSLISLDIDLGEKYKVRQGFEAAGATMKLSKVLEYFRNKDRELYKKAKKIINSLTAMEEEMED